MAFQNIAVYLHTDSRFDAQDAEKKGALRKSAIRAIQQRVGKTCKVHETQEIANAHVAFTVLFLGHSKRWFLRKIGQEM